MTYTTIANRLINKYEYSNHQAADIMEELRNVEPYEQEWDGEYTIWKFDDGSTITVSGNEVWEDFAG